MDDERLGFLLHDGARLMRRDFEQRARNLGLTRAQWSVLAHLSRCEGINQAGLADILDVAPITLGRLLDRLQRGGWVERRAVPGDKRARSVHLTPKSRPALKRVFTIGLQTRKRALGGFSPAEETRLIEMLIRLRANLSNGNGRHGKGGR
ncbi:MAG: MarR family winged helix-turn-helix transcriptional regulator [Reyranellaceae bacterium]